MAAPARNPGFLRMAFTAAASMAKVLGSGLKTVPRNVFEEPLQTCTACTHHTGIRCRLCACFHQREGSAGCMSIVLSGNGRFTRAERVCVWQPVT